MRGWRAAALLCAFLGGASVADAREQAPARGPLDGLSFSVAITHGGRRVGHTTLRFERGWLITSGKRWRDRARYQWRERDGILYFSAAIVKAETHEYDGSVHGETIKAIFSSKQNGEALSYDFNGRREPRLYGAAGSSGSRTRSR
jgi:hypothetical protein